jgi:hypothetical protein
LERSAIATAEFTAEPSAGFGTGAATCQERQFCHAQLLYDSVHDVLSQLIRTAFVPKGNHKFIVADFSAIEARVISWLGVEMWRNDVFATHGKIYEASALQMFKMPIEEVTKGSPLRQKGKIAELAFGYGGSVGALKAMGALDMGLTEDELQPLVTAWRAANPNIVKLWWDVNRAANTASAREVEEYLTRVMRGTSTSEIVVVEGVGDGCSNARHMTKAPDEKERLKAAELLAKRHGMLTDKTKVEGGVQVVIRDDLDDD